MRKSKIDKHLLIFLRDFLYKKSISGLFIFKSGGSKIEEYYLSKTTTELTAHRFRLCALLKSVLPSRAKNQIAQPLSLRVPEPISTQSHISDTFALSGSRAPSGTRPMEASFWLFVVHSAAS